MSKISNEFIELREQRDLKDKKIKKIFDIIEKAQEQEQKGNFFDAADYFEKAAEKAAEIEDEKLHEKIMYKIEDCMIKGEEKREKLDKMFSI